jgi:hypothetical protein
MQQRRRGHDRLKATEWPPNHAALYRKSGDGGGIREAAVANVVQVTNDEMTVE